MVDERAYRIQIKFDAEANGFVATVAELSLSASGQSREEVLQEIEDAIEDAIAKSAAEGQPLPPPSDLIASDAGKLELELSTPLFRELKYHAAIDQISVEEFGKELLIHAIGSLAGRRAPRRSEGSGQDREQRGNRGDDRGNRGDDRGNRGDDRGNRGDDRGNRGPGGRRGGREGYRPELDDKANFLEYLRNLEKGGGRGGRR